MTDANQYKTYREVGTQLSSDILEVYSGRELIVEVASKLDIEFDGLNLAYEFESQMAAHFEFALYEYHRDGTTTAERYLEAERWESETGRDILEATVDADPSLFGVESISDSDPRLTVADLLDSREEHTLLNINLSRTAEPGIVPLFRLVRYDEFTTASGVSFPSPGEEETHLLEEHEHRVEPDEPKAAFRQRFAAFHDLYHDHSIYIQYRRATMSEPTDRFVAEIGTGTITHIIDTDADQSETDSRFSFGIGGPGEVMCSRGNHHPRPQHVSLSEFTAHHNTNKAGLESDAPDEICSYCWSNAREAARREQDADDLSEQIGTIGYWLRWEQKGRAREEWYDIAVRPETTMVELNRLVCRFSTLDDFYPRMCGLEDEYLDSSLNVLPDRQYEEAGDWTYTKADEMMIADVAGRARPQEGDRLSLVYDFGAPSHYYCIAKGVYEPDEIDEVLDGDMIMSTDTAAIVKQKRS